MEASSAAAAVSNAATGGSAVESTPNTVDTTTKLLNDLKSVTEKMDICDSLLRRGTGAAASASASASANSPTDPPSVVVVADAALMAVVGFLEACAPRMVELVEALSMMTTDDNSVGEEVLIQALSVNDRLTKMVADMDKISWPEGAAAAAAAATPLSPNDPVPAGPKSTGEEDLLGDFESF